jgi:hypothetical protein
MFKTNGTYYLEYSGSVTQWLSCATGVYTSKSPLGPFQYSPANPILRKTSGVVTGTGHGSVVKVNCAGLCCRSQAFPRVGSRSTTSARSEHPRSQKERGALGS